MKKVIWLLALCLFAGLEMGCGPKSPAQSPDQIRANARAAVSVAKTAYVIAGNACLDAVAIDPNPKIAQTCADYLDPAYNLIVAAAAAVDATWTSNAACDLAQATDMLTHTLTALKLDPQVAQIITDADTVAKALLGSASCAPMSDAGAE